MLSVPDVISQIPLGVQVVPWDDLKATDRPMQGPAYPNDMINTLAYVSGESVTQPGSMHAATMTEDRRLRVDTGSSGGGGVSPAVMNETIVTVEPFTNGPSYNITGIVLPGSTLYGYSVSVGWGEAMGNIYNNGAWILYLLNSTTNVIVTLVMGQINDLSDAAATGHVPFNQTVMYPVPRDLTPLLATDPNNLHLFIDGTKNLINIQVVLFTS